MGNSIKDDFCIAQESSFLVFNCCGFYVSSKNNDDYFLQLESGEEIVGNATLQN